MNSDNLENLFSKSWDPKKAKTNFEHWKNRYSIQTQHLADLIRIFGASNHFTRLLFFLGEAAWETFTLFPSLSNTAIKNFLLTDLPYQDHDAAIRTLRQRKNILMLRLVNAELKHELPSERIEKHLTATAEYVLQELIKIHTYGNTKLQNGMGVVGMGRLAGEEMNFGSDLDLIFLVKNQEDLSNNNYTSLIRNLSRAMALPAPEGTLYNIDTRLSPHGGAGSLITSLNTFETYHLSSKREIWEKQMMTRSRVVVDYKVHFGKKLREIRQKMFEQSSKINRDTIRQSISEMRLRVEKELGQSRNMYDVKRGYGGIMDIDFITHYLQIMHAKDNIILSEKMGTRSTLIALVSCGILDKNEAEQLTYNYNFLKKIENCLRINHLNSKSQFPRDPEQHQRLCNIFENSESNKNIDNFLDAYQTITTTNRKYFSSILGN